MKTVGRCPTPRKLFEKSLNKNFIKLRERDLGKLAINFNTQNAQRAFHKVFASLFSKSEWGVWGKAHRVLKVINKKTNHASRE